ncbi:MAG: helix-turn-helix transcriptional regulator [Archangium sp.]|nr:helix-turn-helix transcriptional regulator [Archangium sp.]
MRQAASVARFLSDPAGRYVCGETYCYWCTAKGEPPVFGFMLWGRPTEVSMHALVRVLAVELEPRIAPHVSLVDLRRVDAVDPAAFEVLQQYVQRHHAVLKKKVSRLALVRPAGLVGAVVSGFYQVMESPYPTAVFGSLDEALRWLALRPELASELEGLAGRTSGVDGLVSQLRALIGERAGRLELPAAAKQLGVSQRTLQRRLAALKTSFAAELTQARLSLARERLVSSQSPLTSVAVDAGFTSLQVFSATFRRAFGEPPSAWRRKHQR